MVLGIFGGFLLPSLTTTDARLNEWSTHQSRVSGSRGGIVLPNCLTRFVAVIRMKNGVTGLHIRDYIK